MLSSSRFGIPRPHYTAVRSRTASAARGCLANLPLRSARAGRALMEVVLIILVPALCLLMWVVCDKALAATFLGPTSRNSYGMLNPVYELIPTEGGMIVSIQGHGQATFRDRQTGAFVGEIQSRLLETRCGAIAGKQRLLAFGSAMGQLEVWDLDDSSGPLATTEAAKREVIDCQFSRDGKMLICAREDGHLEFRDARTLTLLKSVAPETPAFSIRSISLSPDGRHLLSGCHNGCVQVWDMTSKAPLRTFRIAEERTRPESAVEAIHFLPLANHIVAATRCRGISIWNMQTGQRVRQLDLGEAEVTSATLSEDGTRYMASVARGVVNIWNTQDGRLVGVWKHQQDQARALATGVREGSLAVGDWVGQVQFHTIPASRN